MQQAAAEEGEGSSGQEKDGEEETTPQSEVGKEMAALEARVQVWVRGHVEALCMAHA